MIIESFKFTSKRIPKTKKTATPTKISPKKQSEIQKTAKKTKSKKDNDNEMSVSSDFGDIPIDKDKDEITDEEIKELLNKNIFLPEMKLTPTQTNIKSPPKQSPKSKSKSKQKRVISPQKQTKSKKHGTKTGTVIIYKFAIFPFLA